MRACSSPCSFWLADNLSLLGRNAEARALFERLLGLANDVGLLAEEYEPGSKRMLGNFPQAFTHVSLVNTASQPLASAESPARHRGEDDGSAGMLPRMTARPPSVLRMPRRGFLRRRLVSRNASDRPRLEPPDGAGHEREVHGGAHRDRPRAVGDRGAVELVALAGVGLHLAETAALVERDHGAGQRLHGLVDDLRDRQLDDPGRARDPSTRESAC